MGKAAQNIWPNSITKKCPECGCEFEIFSELSKWTYKLGRYGSAAYYCRYSCWRRALERKENRLKGQ